MAQETDSVKLLVSGSRYLNNYEFFSKAMDTVCTKNTSIIVGDCPTGADAMALKYAKENNYLYTVYNADWKQYGEAAGPIRNRNMIDDGRPTRGIFFRAKDSKGTADCLNYAKKKIKETEIHVVDIDAIQKPSTSF